MDGNPNFVPMSAQWAMIDDLCDKYLGALKAHSASPWTTADITVDLLGTDRMDRRALAMLAATLFNRLAAHND